MDPVRLDPILSAVASPLQTRIINKLQLLSVFAALIGLHQQWFYLETLGGDVCSHCKLNLQKKIFEFNKYHTVILNIYSCVTTWRPPSADEDHVIRSEPRQVESDMTARKDEEDKRKK